jgi:heat shock protein HslJ
MRSFLFLVVGLLCAQAAFSQTSIRMIVNEESKPCRRMMEQTCLQVQKDGSSEWELFYDNIKGFEFEPGYRYEIIVLQTERPEPVPQDLSRYLYKLDRVVSKVAVNAVLEREDVPADNWRVVSLKGMLQNSNDLQIRLSGDGTHISGKSGCNQFTAPVTWNKKRTKMTIGDMALTKMLCDEDRMKLEQAFTSDISGKTFKMQKENGQWIWKRNWKQVLVLEQYNEPVKTEKEMIIDPTPPDRTAWDYFSGKHLKVIQLNGNNLADSKAYLVFDGPNGRFSGNNGCNQTSGSYVIVGNTISFSKVMSTKMACIDETAQATERGMQAIFNSTGLTVDFAEQVMNIYDASGKLVLMLAIDGSK